MFPDDRPHEECGVIGIFAPNEDVARMTFFGLFALQHRGQEAAGLAVADGQTISMLRQGRVDGAWLPQPWATRAVQDGARVLVDERDLWADGRYPTTVLVVRKDYLERHPESLIRGRREGSDKR